MENAEFDRVWRLIESLWPNAAAKKSSVDKAVWRKGLIDFSMQDVSDSIMRYAQKNKFFPDLADVTKGLEKIRVTSSAAEAATMHNARVLAKVLHIAPPEFSSAAEAYVWATEVLHERNARV